MTCRELAEFLDDYLTGLLAGDVRTGFEHHLSLCPNCRRYLASYQATIELERQAFADEGAEAPAEVPDELVRAILDVRRR